MTRQKALSHSGTAGTSADARLRRTTQGAATPHLTVGRGMRVDDRGRPGIMPIVDLARLPATASLAQVVASFNRLLDEMAGAGHSE